MLTYSFAEDQGPLYEYIYQRIKENIIDGNLQQGVKDATLSRMIMTASFD